MPAGRHGLPGHRVSPNASSVGRRITAAWSNPARKAGTRPWASPHGEAGGVTPEDVGALPPLSLEKFWGRKLKKRLPPGGRMPTMVLPKEVRDGASRHGVRAVRRLTDRGSFARGGEESARRRDGQSSQRGSEKVPGGSVFSVSAIGWMQTPLSMRRGFPR
jgi:hypothetical protein